jgi:hypothetical protein
MNYYAHTIENEKRQTIFAFRCFPHELLTALEFAERNGGQPHRLDDLAEIQID